MLAWPQLRARVAQRISATHSGQVKHLQEASENGCEGARKHGDASNNNVQQYVRKTCEHSLHARHSDALCCEEPSFGGPVLALSLPLDRGGA
jgi:hypothetical protein